MKAQSVKQIEIFSEAELEGLEFVPEELEAIEAEQLPDLDSIAFEDVAELMEALLMSSENIAGDFKPALERLQLWNSLRDRLRRLRGRPPQTPPPPSPPPPYRPRLQPRPAGQAPRPSSPPPYQSPSPSPPPYRPRSRSSSRGRR